MLGVGMMGSFHTQLLSRSVRGARVTVVNDVIAQRGDALAAQVGARAVGDPFEAINADDVDAVVIATPGAAHENQVFACLHRGVPVLCEKPLTTDPASAYRIVQTEHERGRQLVQVGFMRRFDPEYAALREMITSGAVGNPLLVHCAHRNPESPTHVTSPMMLTDSAVHEIDVIRFLFDEEIIAVTVLQPKPTSKAPAGVSDPMMVLLETTSGRLADIELFARTGVAYEVRTEVVGDAGSAIIGLDTNLLHTNADGHCRRKLTPSFIQRFALAYQCELQEWVDAAKQGTIAGPGSWDGYAALAVCDAGIEAIRTRARTEVVMNARP